MHDTNVIGFTPVFAFLLFAVAFIRSGISATIPAGSSGEQVQLTIRTAGGKELIAAEARIK